MCNLLVLPIMAQQGGKENYPVTVKVMTYNTYSGRKLGIDKIAEVINKIDPDVVSLQEIERNTNVNPWDTPVKLSKLTGMKYYLFVHALNIPTGGDYGNVILSKFPISDEHSFHLKGLAPEDYIRSFGYVKVTKGCKKFYFFTTHLDCKYEDAYRLQQTEEILKCAEQLKLPIILAGDLNTRRGSATISAFEKFFTVNCLSDGSPWTAPAPKPTYTCDWILYEPNDMLEVKSYNVCYWANKESDHFPVVAVYSFKY